MRCIEISLCILQLTQLLRLTLTWDVLKLQIPVTICGFTFWLTLTWDVLKWRICNYFRLPYKININMRCIEIDDSYNFCGMRSRLTLTWDVLKYQRQFSSTLPQVININMRCIEIKIVQGDVKKFDKININMRCIEML